LPPPYLRAFLGLCNLVVAGKEQIKIRCYPAVLLFESGILSVELRMISPDQAVSLESFISVAVNLFRHQFARIEISPDIVRLASRAYYHSSYKWNLFNRVSLLRIERLHDKLVCKQTETHEEDDFRFKLAPLNVLPESNSSEQLFSLISTLFRTISFAAGQPRVGLSFLLRGHGAIPELGDFWWGHPHVYLIRFSDQQETATDNERVHKTAFGSILARSLIHDPNVANQFLPQDCRPFQDINGYITNAATLWVQSLSGLRQLESQGADDLRCWIHDSHVTVELLEYGYMLHRSLLGQIITYAKIDEVLHARRALLDLELGMHEASHFGEVRTRLNNGWRELGLDIIKAQIKDALSIQETRTRLVEARIAGKVGRALTIFFGILAFPRLSNQVLMPLWELLHLPKPVNEAASQTLMNVISFIVVILVSYILTRRLWNHTLNE
jgi:hypothetical protein